MADSNAHDNGPSTDPSNHTTIGLHNHDAGFNNVEEDGQDIDGDDVSLSSVYRSKRALLKLDDRTRPAIMAARYLRVIAVQSAAMPKTTTGKMDDVIMQWEAVGISSRTTIQNLIVKI